MANPTDLEAPKLQLSNLYQAKSSQNYYPIQIPSPEGVAHEWFNNEHLQPMAEPKALPPSFGDSIVESFKDNDWNLASNYIAQQDILSIPSDEVAPAGWYPQQETQYFDGISEKNQGFLLEANNPRDMRNRYFMAMEQQQKESQYNDGSFLAHLVGGFGGGAVSPTTYLGILGELKAATMSARLAQDFAGIAGGSAAHELLVQSNKVQADMNDYVLDTMRDTLFGTAFLGGAITISKGFDSGKLFNVRNVMNLNDKDINLVPVIPKEGPVTKIMASSRSASAAEVDEAQKFADSSFAKEGLFKLPILGDMMIKGASSINPIIRGMNSPSETMRGFMNRTGSHGIITEGTLKGEASPVNFDDSLEILKADNRTMFWQYNAMYRERNPKDLTKSSPDYANKETFGAEVDSAIRNQQPSEHSAVNDAADFLSGKMNQSYADLRSAYGFPEKWLKPKTAEGYVMRVYEPGRMKLERNEFIQATGAWYKGADQYIKQRMQPIEDLKVAVKEKRASKGDLKAAQESLQNELRDNDDLRIHVKDIAALSANEANQLKSLLKPLDKIKKELKAKKKQLYSASKEDKQKIKDEIGELKDKHTIEEDRLQQLAQQGKVDESFYEKIPDSQLVKFKNPRDRLEFRPLFESDYHIDQHVEGAYDTILNQTPEETANQVLNGLLGSRGENPTYQRTFLVPDEVVSPWLNKNIAQNVASYRMTLGRRTLIKNIFKDVTLDGGVKPLALRMDRDYRNMRDSLHSELGKLKAEKEQTKEVKAKIKDVEKQLMKVDKQRASDIEDMNLAYNKMMGRARGSRKQREYSSIVRNFAVATKLGASPLYVATDLASIPFKNGFWPSIRDGLLPMLKNVSSLIKKGKGKNYVTNAPHAHMGLNHTLTAMQDKNWYGSSQPYIPWGNRIANGMEKIAHLSGNISGSNFIENFLQEVVAGIVQSKIIRYLIDHEKGNLKPKDKEKLLLYGIKPEELGPGMLKQYRSVGADGNGFGGHLAKFWEWENKELANKFSEAVYRGTRDTLVRRGMFDAPFALDDPLIGMIMMFKGWTCASLTRYLVPLLQRPDAEKLIGTTLMLGMGSLITPLRRITKGEDPIQEDDNMFWNAMVDGGVFSILTDTIEDANVLLGGTLLKDIRNDRYANRTITGALMGPLGSMGDDFVQILKMMASGTLNQNGVNRIARNIPFLQSWYLRGLSNKMVESLGLPETYDKAVNGA